MFRHPHTIPVNRGCVFPIPQPFPGLFYMLWSSRDDPVSDQPVARVGRGFTHEAERKEYWKELVSAH